MLNQLNSFSGGWQMQVQLAKVPVSRADLILLDEPTNHLDLESVIWFENWLQSYSGTAFIISHDRAFLDKVTTDSVHLCQKKNLNYIQEIDDVYKAVSVRFIIAN